MNKNEWRKVKLGDVISARNERYKPDDDYISKLQRIDKIDFTGNIFLSNNPSKTDMILIKPGDFVISGINVAKGALAVYNGTEEVSATIHYSSYTLNEKELYLDYFKSFLRSSEFLRLLQEQIPGGIKTEVKPKHILPLEISLPPLSEQKRISAKLQSIQAQHTELTAEIQNQKSYIKQLKQAILQDAVTGKLTEDWRKTQAGKNAGNARELLEQIKAEKEKLIAEGKIKKQKPLPPIKQEEIPFDLPAGWVWTRLGVVIDDKPKNGYSPKEVSYPTEIKSLKLGATTWGTFNSNEYKYIDEVIPKESPYWLKNGDILIQRSNSLDYVGVSAVYDREDFQFIYPDLMMKIRSVIISAKSLHLLLSSPYMRNYFRANAKGAQKTMPKINQDIVINALLPLPPLAEQEEIVRRVDVLFAQVKELEQEVEKREKYAESLMQVVLSEALRG
ncbi:MAG: restriction endonuclease subunit S [Leptospiraceae bacterium]|nr:restriction endonuclease subunit S [Leptospiraceae bacterium]MCP5499589.1 restriction endonuclease subunit S [Leptospiraceae bacterium]